MAGCVLGAPLMRLLALPDRPVPAIRRAPWQVVVMAAAVAELAQ
jgi:hypothetical protein